MVAQLGYVQIAFVVPRDFFGCIETRIAAFSIDRTMLLRFAGQNSNGTTAGNLSDRFVTQCHVNVPSFVDGEATWPLKVVARQISVGITRAAYIVERRNTSIRRDEAYCPCPAVGDVNRALIVHGNGFRVDEARFRPFAIRVSFLASGPGN